MTQNIFYFIILAALIWIVHKRFNVFNLFNPFVLFFIYHTVFFYIGWFLLPQYGNTLLINPYVMVYACYGLTAAVISAVCAEALFFSVDRPKFTTPILVPARPAEARAGRTAGLLLFGMGILLTILFFYDTGSVPFLHEFADSFRIEARKGKGYITMLCIGMTTFGVMTITVNGAKRYFYYLFLILGFLFLLGLGNRGPALKLLLAGAILRMVWTNKTYPRGRIILLGIGLFVLLVVLGAIRTESAQQGATLFEVMSARYSWRPKVTFYNFSRILDYYSASRDFLHGRGFLMDLSVLLPGSQPNFGTWLKERIGLTFAGGSLPPTYLGEAYANFGLIGIFIAPLVYGFGLQFLYMLLAHKGVSPDRSAILLALSISLMGVPNMGLMTPLLYGALLYLTVHGIALLIKSMVISVPTLASTSRRPEPVQNVLETGEQ